MYTARLSYNSEYEADSFYEAGNFAAEEIYASEGELTAIIYKLDKPIMTMRLVDGEIVTE